MTAPLAGVLVVALEHAVAAPFCSSWLADAGARVIKVERPEGDFAREYDHVVHGESAYFVWLNRGKEPIVGRIAYPELISKLRLARIAFASVVAELSSHQQLPRTVAETRSGPVALVEPPIRRQGEVFEARPVPGVGQHSRALREEFSE